MVKNLNLQCVVEGFKSLHLQPMQMAYIIQVPYLGNHAQVYCQPRPLKLGSQARLVKLPMLSHLGKLLKLNFLSQATLVRPLKLNCLVLFDQVLTATWHHTIGPKIIISQFQVAKWQFINGQFKFFNLAQVSHGNFLCQ